MSFWLSKAGIVLFCLALISSPTIPSAYARDDIEGEGSPIERFKQSENIQESLQDWEFQPGDWIVANVLANTLQFVRADNSEISARIRIGSGINNHRTICAVGRCYDPITPQKTWEIRSKHQQNTWWIFGTREPGVKEMLFFRLYEVKGDERIHTPYGIHTTPNVDIIMEKSEGFGSWGCVLTRYDLLKSIETLYQLNGERITVVTTGVDAEEML